MSRPPDRSGTVLPDLAAARRTSLREVPLSSEPLFQGRFLNLVRDTVRLPDGRTATREYVRHPGAVVIVPLLDDGRVVVERQYRHPVGLEMLEFPAGKLDADEPDFRCGRRELLEETGFRAEQWARAGRMHLAIAYSTEVIHIWFARGLTAGERHLDEGEFLDVLAATPAELMQAAADGRLTDAKTLTALLWLHNVQSGLWSLEWRPEAEWDAVS